MNPYEPPQSSIEPLPIAFEVKPFVRTREGLIHAAALCAAGGRLQFAAGLLGVLAVLLGLFSEFEGPFEKPILFLSIIVTVVLWTWGALKKFRGYLELAKYVTEDPQRNLYTLAQFQWWLQLALVILLCLTFPWPRFSGELFFVSLGTLLILCYLHAVVIQVKVLRRWCARLELPSAANGYLAGGIAVVLCSGLELVLLNLGHRHDGALHVVLCVLLAITAWDYSQRYQAVQEALLEQHE